MGELEGLEGGLNWCLTKGLIATACNERVCEEMGEVESLGWGLNKCLVERYRLVLFPKNREIDLPSTA